MRESSRIIEGVKPFRELFYLDCFFNSFFSAVEYFDVDVVSYLANDVYVYFNDNTDQDNMINVKMVSCREFEERLDAIGIKREVKEVSENIIEDIENSILNDKLVLIYVDFFYESIRPDVFMKEHGQHVILITGFNREEKKLNIVEHKNKDSLQYEHREIDYSDIEEAYKSYIETIYDSKEKYSFYSLSKLEENRSNENTKKCSRELLIDNHKGKKEKIYEGLESLKEFSKEFSEIVLCEETLEKKYDGLLKTLNNIINLKEVEKYRLNSLFNSEFELNRILEEILENWRQIRSVLVKYSYMGRYKMRSFEKSVERFKEIYELEREFNREFFGVIG